MKVEADKTMRFEQRVSMLSDKNGQRSYLAKNLRNTFVSIITPFKRKLDKLLLDKEERERIIENPNDILTFSAEVGKGKKRIQGYNVMKALTEAYYFISGFNYLITQGELSGAGILIEGDDDEPMMTEQVSEASDTNVKESSANNADNTEENNAYVENADDNQDNSESNENAENSDIEINSDGFNESTNDEDLFSEPSSNDDENTDSTSDVNSEEDKDSNKLDKEV